MVAGCKVRESHYSRYSVQHIQIASRQLQMTGGSQLDNVINRHCCTWRNVLSCLWTYTGWLPACCSFCCAPSPSPSPVQLAKQCMVPMHACKCVFSVFVYNNIIIYNQHHIITLQQVREQICNVMSHQPGSCWLLRCLSAGACERARREHTGNRQQQCSQWPISFTRGCFRLCACLCAQYICSYICCSML